MSTYTLFFKISKHVGLLKVIFVISNLSVFIVKSVTCLLFFEMCGAFIYDIICDEFL